MHSAVPSTNVQIPAAFAGLFQPARYKTYFGGRGAGRTTNFTRALLIDAAQTPQIILCTREYQNSIADSVHRALTQQIKELNLGYYFRVTDNYISSICGSEFIFKGLRNIDELKSTEQIGKCWVEEAHRMTKRSWEILPPTIRANNSEIWVSFNLEDVESPTYQKLVVNPPADSIVRKVNYDENPFFPAVLEKERQDALRLIREAKSDSERAQAQADYDHIWLGEARRMAAAGVLKRWEIREFETPRDARFFHGADWGFAVDPTALVRSFIQDDALYIDMEAFGRGIEIDDTPKLFEEIPTSREWPIKADNSRPETISYMSRKGFAIDAAEKWNGSVEDGIAHLNGFTRIYIHPRCVNVAREARLYSYKVDRITQEILPIIVDANNHGWDAVRYSLDGYIQSRGGSGMWARLAE